ncbi:Uncharacterised protein [Chlamydia trachomatis]|nr:Uncharacterised protein [Chlamydia trachomatis]
MQHFPNIRLNEETVGADFLIGIGKGIKTNNRGAMLGKIFQIFLDKVASGLGRYI